MLVDVVRVHGCKHIECVIGLGSLRKKKKSEAIRKEERLFCNERSLRLVFDDDYNYDYDDYYVIGTRMT